MRRHIDRPTVAPLNRGAEAGRVSTTGIASQAAFDLACDVCYWAREQRLDRARAGRARAGAGTEKGRPWTAQAEAARRLCFLRRTARARHRVYSEASCVFGELRSIHRGLLTVQHKGEV